MADETGVPTGETSPWSLQQVKVSMIVAWMPQTKSTDEHAEPLSSSPLTNPLSQESHRSAFRPKIRASGDDICLRCFHGTNGGDCLAPPRHEREHEHLFITCLMHRHVSRRRR
jgi:hypothetical protein